MENDSGDLERAKMTLDTVKHLSTLDTGSILVIGALVDKFHKPLQLIYWLDFAIGVLLLSLCACVVFLTWEVRRTPNLVKIAGILFLVGVACFLYFLEPNLLANPK